METLSWTLDPECPAQSICSALPPTSGLIGPVTINDIPLESFTIYSLELKMSFFKRYVPPSAQDTLEIRELEVSISSFCR